MKFEKIIKDVRKGKPFTDGLIKYRWNKKKNRIERWETNLTYMVRHKKPFWSVFNADILLDEILLSDWEIVDE